MQELRILRWCDVCNAENEGARVEATERYLVVVGLPDGRRMTPRLVETCEQHGKPFREMRDLVEQVGILPKAKGNREPEPEAEPQPAPSVPKPRPEPAPEPEPKPKRYPSQAKYQMSMAACPACGVEMRSHSLTGHLKLIHDAKPYVHPKKCPDCGESYGGDAGAMATHRRRKHGWDHIAELAKRARR